MQEIAEISNTIRLNSLELSLGAWKSEIPPGHDYSELYYILSKFRGLVNLYLRLAGPMDWSLISIGIQNHQATLKCLVIAERFLDVTELDGDVNWKSQVRTTTSSLKLQCLGVTNDLEYLVGLPIPY